MTNAEREDARVQVQPIDASRDAPGVRLQEPLDRAARTMSPLGLVVAAHFAPAALALYWLTGSLVGAVQQWAVNRFVLSRAAAGTA